MRRALTALGLTAVLLGPGPGCAMTCKKWVSHDDVLNTWIGAKLTDYEQQNGFSPISAMVRPQHQHEYKYLSHEEYISGQRYYCYDYIDADDDTGKITSWRYEGNDCVGYCAD